MLINPQSPGKIQNVDPSKGVHMTYPLGVRVPNWGIYFLDPPGGLGRGFYLRFRTGLAYCRGLDN